MTSDYTLTRSINNKSFRFGIIFGRLSFAKNIADWESKLAQFIRIRSGIAAISLNKNIFEKVDPLKISESDIKKILGKKLSDEYGSYHEVKDNILEGPIKPFSVDFITDVHGRIMQNKKEAKRLRKTKRLLPKDVMEHGVIRQIEFEVKTLPSQIPQKLKDFVEWFNDSLDEENPLIMAAIAHFKIAQIHPFEDGNGRLSRILEYFTFRCGGVNLYELISTEYYHLLHSERYYSLIEECIENDDMTSWIEFYTEILLTALTDSAKMIYRFSGGSIDILNNIVIELTELEEQVVEIMMRTEYLGPSEIAKKLDYSRQNIYRALRSLNQKGILKKISDLTGRHYRIGK